MSISNKDKIELSKCIRSSNNYIILTTGRAGTDFLQSCYDDHPEIATTSEKTNSLPRFIKEKREILENSREVFSALVIDKLLYSFTPYLNEIENWQISHKDSYKKANVDIFISALSYLLSFDENCENYLSITRCIILSFSFSIGKSVPKIKTILIHLHHIKEISFYSKNLDENDLTLVCSRNPFDLVASGVFHWISYWEKTNDFCQCNNYSHYRKVLTRTLFDYEEIHEKLRFSKTKIYLSILEKLSDINYLNKINKFLSIKLFKKYPESTVLGITRRGDLLSQDKRKNAFGSFDPLLVRRGSPFKRIGFIDSIVKKLKPTKRIAYYKLNSELNFIKKILNFNLLLRIIIFLAFLPIPSKIEFFYFRNILKRIFQILFSKELNFKEKNKQFIILIFYTFLHPYEYILVRLTKLRAFIKNLEDIKLINELAG